MLMDQSVFFILYDIDLEDLIKLNTIAIKSDMICFEFAVEFERW